MREITFTIKIPTSADFLSVLLFFWHRLRQALLVISKERKSYYFFLVIATTGFIAWLYVGLASSLLLSVFLVFLAFRIDHRFFSGASLVVLISVPVLYFFEKNDLASVFLIYSFYFLVLTVLLLFLRLFVYKGIASWSRRVKDLFDRLIVKTDTNKEYSAMWVAGGIIVVYFLLFGTISLSVKIQKLFIPRSGEQAESGSFFDSDGDGLFDRDETEVYHTNPSKEDSDGDGYSDKIELDSGFDPHGKGRIIIKENL